MFLLLGFISLIFLFERFILAGSFFHSGKLKNIDEIQNSNNGVCDIDLIVFISSILICGFVIG